MAVDQRLLNFDLIVPIVERELGRIHLDDSLTPAPLHEILEGGRGFGNF